MSFPMSFAVIGSVIPGEQIRYPVRIANYPDGSHAVSHRIKPIDPVKQFPQMESENTKGHPLMEKLKQIATLKLIGAPDRTIVSLIVQQSLALGVVGWGFGLILILLIKDYFPRRVVLEPVNAAALGGIIIVVCIAASGLGVRAALKVDPATAIGG